MPRAQEQCGLAAGHAGDHRSSASVVYARDRTRTEYERAYYKANREKIRARSRAYYEANREAEIARGRAYYAANPARFAAYTAAKIASGDNAARKARESRRKADERVSDNIDPRLEALLGGLICPANPTT